MCREWHKLASYEAVLLPVPCCAQRWPIKERRQIERSERIQNNNFVGCVSVDRLVEREEGGCVVEGFVKGGVWGGVRSSEACEEFIEVTFALSGGNRRARAVVVVE